MGGARSLVPSKKGTPVQTGQQGKGRTERRAVARVFECVLWLAHTIVRATGCPRAGHHTLDNWRLPVRFGVAARRMPLPRFSLQHCPQTGHRLPAPCAGRRLEALSRRCFQPLSRQIERGMTWSAVRAPSWPQIQQVCDAVRACLRARSYGRPRRPALLATVQGSAVAVAVAACASGGHGWLPTVEVNLRGLECHRFPAGARKTRQHLRCCSELGVRWCAAIGLGRPICGWCGG